MNEGPIYRLPPIYNVTEVYGQLSEMTDEGLIAAKVPEAWKRTKGKGVRVCVLDTGVDLNHPDLKIAEAFDFTGRRNVFDRQRHGTHVCGYINAQHNDQLVRGGAPEAEMFVGKVLDDFGNGLSPWIVAGIRWATQIKAHVLSMSFGSNQQDPAIIEALHAYVAGGGIPIAAAGNDGQNLVNWPARDKLVIAVGAVDRFGRRAAFSSGGDEIDIAAVGVDVVSTVPGGGVAKMSGTSMATPGVSAIACLAIAHHLAGPDASGTPIRTPADMIEHLKKSAQKFADPNTKQFGPGTIDAEAMIGKDDPIPDPVAPAVREERIGDVVLRWPSTGRGFMEIDRASP